MLRTMKININSIEDYQYYLEQIGECEKVINCLGSTQYFNDLLSLRTIAKSSNDRGHEIARLHLDNELIQFIKDKYQKRIADYNSKIKDLVED